MVWRVAIEMGAWLRQVTGVKTRVREEVAHG